MSGHLARRSGRAPDPLGLLLALACWALVACYPSAPEPPNIIIRWDHANTGTYRAGAEIVAVVSGVEVGRCPAPECKHEIVTRCTVQGCDPATCDLSRCVACGADVTSAAQPFSVQPGLPTTGIPVGLDGPAAAMGLPVAEGLAVDQPLHVVLPDGSHYGCDQRLACDLARCQSCGERR